MPAPTNISAATAIALTLPANLSQDVNDAGTTYTVWYKYTATEDGELGIFGFGDLVTYQPTLATFTPDGVTPFSILSTPTNQRLQLPVVSGQTYYFRFTSSGGNVTPAVLLLTAELFATQTIPAGSILVNDDSTGFPAAVLSSVTDANPLAFKQPFAAGEAGSILPSGIMCFEDGDIAHDLSGVTGIALYDSTLTELLTLSRTDLGLPTGFMSICHDGVDTFYVGTAGSGGTHAKITTVSSAGVIGPTSWTLPSAGLVCIGVNPAETVLYHMGQGSSSGAAVKQWDLVNDLALSDLVAGEVGYTPFHDLLVFADGTLVIGYRAAGDGFIRHYASDGSIIDQFEQTTTLRSDDRLAFATDEDSFWLWRHRGAAGATVGISQFDQIQLSDGTVLNSIQGVQFETGAYSAAATATPLADFGHSFSCPFLVLRASATVPPPAIVSVSAMACERPTVQHIVITGTGFDADATVTGTDPLGAALDLTIESITDTAIAITFETVEYGEFCFLVTNPDAQVSSEFCIQSTSCTEITKMRRLRRATHIANDGRWAVYHAFNLVYESGVGLTSGQGDDPEFLLRWSDDGGHEFSDWHAIKIGKIGEYTKRAVWRRLGRSRKRTFELVVTDPVKIAWLDAIIDASNGTH